MVSAFEGSDSDLIKTRKEQLAKLPTPGVFIDIGPGYPHSEAWAVREVWPEARIIGFEANPENYKRLKDSGYPGELHNIAVSDKGGELTFYEIQKGDLSLYTDSPDRPKVQVKTESLDSLSEKYGPFNNAFIWADIEGAELVMLKGAAGLFADGQVCGVNMEVRDKPYADGWCSADDVSRQMEEYGFELSKEYGHVTGYVDYRDAIYQPKARFRIKVVIISHNQPESVDSLYGQLSEGFDDVEVWDTDSDPEKVPCSITIADQNIYWEGVWNAAMQRFGDYDALWVLGGDITLLQPAAAYRKALTDAMPFGCWSPCIRGRAHPFMRVEHYGHQSPKSVKNIEGMALAVSGDLIREIGGKLELTTTIGFGQDYWLCYRARKSGMRNIIDGRAIVSHPPGIGYNEREAHDAMEEVFSARYGGDFRRTIFEYDQRYEGNLIKNQEAGKMLTVITVENGWGVPEIEEIMQQMPDVRLVVMQKGVSNFDVKNATVLPFTTDIDELIAQADMALFTRVGPANEQEYRKILESGVPTVVHSSYQQGRIEHEKNGFVYGNLSWAVSWLKELVKNESLRKSISVSWNTEAVKPEPPESFEEAVKDAEEGNVVPMEVALSEVPPGLEVLPDKALATYNPDDILVTVITPTYRRDGKIIRRSYDCLKLQTEGNWEQLICSDGGLEDHVEALVGQIGDSRQQYNFLTSKKDGDYGNRCRAEMLTKARGKYVLFFDDDNIILPGFIEKMVAALESAEPEIGFVVCDVMHFGPLNEEESGKPPIVLKGEPIKLYHVDPLQILVRREAMQDVGWNIDRGYTADGVSLEALGNKYKHIKLNEVLGVHV